MSWISDVRSDLKNLEFSHKKLRNFGLLVGGVFIGVSVWLLYFSTFGMGKSHYFLLHYILLFFGGTLFLFGLLFPQLLKSTFKIWMGIAFFIGWIVSRIIISIMFYLIVTPLGTIAKLFGHKFLDEMFKDGKSSYWIMKSPDKSIDYKKMY